MKIAIITHYHNSLNYGGVLQAYALCKTLTNKGYVAEQLCFDIQKSSNGIKKQGKFRKFIKNPIKISFNIMKIMLNKNLTKKLSSRKDKFSCFRKLIPHSKEIYNDITIGETVKEYNVFITGSDQVWNPEWYYPAYMLSFVPKDLPKISYAASLSVNELSEEQKQRFKKDLADYKAISVREKNATELLKNIAPVPVEWVLDPTLLLSQEEWDEICPDRIIKGDYIFCYFLGRDKNQRRLVKEFAKKNKLKIVTLPYLAGGYNKSDVFFGNKKIYDASPADFISLIKYAKYVFTDSFHATVFSCVYGRSFFVFGRTDFEGMSSRIDSLLEMFGSNERFCNKTNKFTLKYIESLKTIKKVDNKGLEEMKEKSLFFLQKALQN